MLSVSEIRKNFTAEFEGAANAEDLERLKIKYLGRRGALNGIFGSLKNMPLAKRKVVAQQAQELKKEIEDAITGSRESGVRSKEFSVDLTAPGKRPERGHLHPLTIVEQDIRKIFLSMGFSVVEGPEVENEHYNFDALNIPQNHPARDAWDTFWLERNPKLRIHPNDRNKSFRGIRVNSDFSGRLLLRTHTSPVQIRYMEQHNPPLQIIVPGRVFRYEATDASHEINFHQLEGLMVGKNISLANFKFVVEEFFKKFFRVQKIDFRYRPSYFPFVEPGLEVDIKLAAGNSQLATGKNKQVTRNQKPVWLEVMGAGMVHPHVFEYAHYNPRDWQGFAFGMGIDRLAMIKYKIPDIRMFYNGDLRLVKQF